MKITKKYRDSVLSALCIISWFKIVFQIFKSASNETDVRKFIMTSMITIAVGIIGGIILIFFNISKNKKLKFSFVYNAFGTLNILIGSFGMLLPQATGKPSPYIITASLTIGIVMYRTIYYQH